MTRFFVALVALSAPMLLAGCAEVQDHEPAAKRPFPAFQSEVYEVLLRDCGFPACHGDTQRFFRVFGPGRVRLPGKMTTPGALDDPTVNEQAVTYALAQSMIDPDDPARSPLLRKPLAVEAGGASHFGIDDYGRDVYRTDQDSGYVALARWVLTLPEAPAPTP